MRTTIVVASILLALTLTARAQDVRADVQTEPVAPELLLPPEDGCAFEKVETVPVKHRDPSAPIEWKSPSPNGEPPAAAPSPDAPKPAVVEKAPLPIAPNIEMKCGRGKVLIHVMAPTQVSHYTGEKIPVTLEVVLAPGAVVDLRSVDLNDNSSGYELVGEPQARVDQVEVGTKVTFQLTVQSFETGKQYLPVSLTLRYATLVSEEGTPIWQDLVTTDLVLLHHDTVPPGTKSDLFMTDHALAQMRISWAYVPSLVLGFLSLGLAALLFLVRTINRLRPRHLLSIDQSTWLALDETIVSGNKMGFTQRHYELISSALKTFLQARYGLSTFESSIVENNLKEVPIAVDVISALSILHAAIYRGETISQSRHEELVAHLCKIVPKPRSL